MSRPGALLLLVLAASPGYDPLAVGAAVPQVWDGTATDAARRRELPVRVYLPAEPGPAPVVLFSHGLGGSRENNAYLGQHWARRGYVAVFLQHPGSDEAVWKGVPREGRLAALREAASLEAFLDRVKDVPAVLDALGAWSRQPGHPLLGRLDLSRVGLSGHSFGAVTTQALAGQSFPLVGTAFTDPRIAAAVVMSPSLPRRGSAAEAFATVRVPWLLMTGTRDEAPIGGQTAASRLGVYPALPPGGRYELVLDGASHMAFGDRELDPREARNPRHHPAILALSTAFWDATLRGAPAARAWLDGPGARTVLEPADRWQRK